MNHSDIPQKIQELQNEIDRLKRLQQFQNPQSNITINSGNKSSGGCLAGIIILFVVFIGALLFWIFKPNLKGSLDLKKSQTEQLSLKLKSCSAGTAFVPQFFGVQFETEANYIIQTQGSEATSSVLIWPKDNAKNVLFLLNSQCSTFSIENHFTDVTINDVRAMSGKISLDCSTTPLGHLQLNAEYKNCH